MNSLIAHKNNIDLNAYSKSHHSIVHAIQTMRRKLDRPAFTMHEIADFLGVALHTISRRFKEMIEKGILEKAGDWKYMKYDTASGKARIYKRALFKIRPADQLTPDNV